MLASLRRLESALLLFLGSPWVDFLHEVELPYLDQAVGSLFGNHMIPDPRRSSVQYGFSRRPSVRSC
jgi:hypothetical protein